MFLPEFFGNAVRLELNQLLLKIAGQGRGLAGRGQTLAQLGFAQVGLIHSDRRSHLPQRQIALEAQPAQKWPEPVRPRT